MSETNVEYPGLVFPVGARAEVFISRLSAGEQSIEYTGNILRRVCEVFGETACQATCQLRDADLERFNINEDKECADANLRDALLELGLQPKEVLMVAVTGNKVGFADELDTYEDRGEVKKNPEGWREIPGYNAFFSRVGEVSGIGSRLADCAHLSFEFPDSRGDMVIGFEHGTRTNMNGASAHAFEIEGRKASYTEYVLTEAISHYNANPADIVIRLSASIQPQNFVKHFESEEQREGHIPGWVADGFAWNVSRPEWQEGDAYDPEDTWHADSRGLILHDIVEAMERLGIPFNNFDGTGMIDPADTAGEFSSHENRERYGDTRDLYLVRVRDEV